MLTPFSQIDPQELVISRVVLIILLFISPGEYVNMQIMIQEIRDGAQEFAFQTSSQEMPFFLVHELPLNIKAYRTRPLLSRYNLPTSKSTAMNLNISSIFTISQPQLF